MVAEKRQFCGVGFPVLLEKSYLSQPQRGLHVVAELGIAIFKVLFAVDQMEFAVLHSRALSSSLRLIEAHAEHAEVVESSGIGPFEIRLHSADH